MFSFFGKSSTSLMSATSTFLVLDDTEIPGVDTWLSLISLSLGTSLMVGCNEKVNIRNVNDISLLTEAISLDELYELRDSVIEKERVLSLKKRGE